MKNKFYSLIIILTSSQLLVSCQTTNKDKRTPQSQSLSSHNPLVRIAEKMRIAQDYRTAIPLYQQAISLEPHEPDAHLGLGKSLAALGYYDEAVKELRPLTANSKNIAAHKELGKIYIAMDKPEKCIDVYNVVHRKNPKDVSAMNGLGVCYDLKGDQNQARAWYKKALAMNPGHVGVQSNLGLSLVLEGKYKEGIEILSKIVDGPSATERDRQNLALAYGLSGNMDRAAQIYSIDLSNHDVRSNLAYIHQLISSKRQLQQQMSQATVLETEQTIAQGGESIPGGNEFLDYDQK